MTGGEMRGFFKILLWIFGGFIALCGALLLVAQVFGDRTDPRLYDRARWVAERGAEPPVGRYPMLPEVEKLLRPGMTREEVIDLLGMPDGRSDERFIYDLGVRIIDYDSFFIEFDANGRVTGWRISYG